MFQANMVAHLWDLVDEGLESALDLLQGRIGLTGLCTPVTSGALEHLRYAGGVSPRIFRTRGGVFFQPDKTLYENTRCKPLLCEWLKTRNWLDKLSEQCRARGFGLRAVIECTNIGRIAAHDPHFARKNVFGDVSLSRICPANADVAEFIRSLAVDVCSNYAIEAVELVGLDAMPSMIDDPYHTLGLGGWQLLALCFCESCRQSAVAAGVDVESAARSATVRLETVFSTGQPIEQPLVSLVADDPPLAAFIAWYRDRITGLLHGVRDSCGGRVVSHTRAMRSEDELAAGPGYIRGVHAVVCDYVGWEIAPLERLIERMRDVLDTQQVLEVQLLAHSPAADDDQALVRNLTRMAELGITSANLDHYGCLPRARLDTVKQAIRFARRMSR
ncbi:MAG: hypothetical protein KAV82_14260 [Phycisphaerae bacterium]|nr:hypothetical protein [Phycisphaerae bacterium]